MENVSEHKSIRTKPSQARGKERIRLILTTAHDLFHEHGIEAVTTNDIAAAAGIPIGSVYRYFPNKGAIVLALADNYVAGLISLYDQIGDQLRYTKLSWEEAIVLIVDAWATYARLNGAFGFLFFQRVTPALRKPASRRRSQLVRAFGALLRKRCPNLEDRAIALAFRFTWDAKALAVNPEVDEADPTLYKDAAHVIATYLNECCNTHIHA